LIRAQRRTAICLQTTAAEVSVAQVARRYALNANMIFKWLHDARYAPGSAQGAVDAPDFLPVEIVTPTRSESRPARLAQQRLAQQRLAQQRLAQQRLARQRLARLPA